MNERIMELAEQARDYADYYAMLSGVKEQDIFTEKFAELIALECAKIADEPSGWQPGYRIKRHFGLD